jgi:hypothetical protein
VSGDLFPGRVAHPIGDDLDRCYTPAALALACARVAVPLALQLARGGPVRVVEPSVGGGVFARSVRRVLKDAHGRDAHITGYDLDPNAPGLLDVDRAVSRSWLDVRAPEFDGSATALIIGNPPFGEAVAHASRALGVRDRTGCVVALILPLAYLGVGAWGEIWRKRPPSSVHVIPGRPWPARVRECALYVWTGDPHEQRDGQPLPGLHWLPATTEAERPRG